MDSFFHKYILREKNKQVLVFLFFVSNTRVYFFLLKILDEITQDILLYSNLFELFADFGYKFIYLDFYSPRKHDLFFLQNTTNDTTLLDK